MGEYEPTIQERSQLKATTIGRDDIGPIPCTWPKGANPVCLVEVMLRKNAGGYECASFAVKSLSPSIVIGSKLLRRLPVRRLIDEAIARHVADQVHHAERVLAEPPPGVQILGDGIRIGTPTVDAAWLEGKRAFWQQKAHEAKQMMPTGTGTGRRYPPGHYERVAEIVNEAKIARIPTSSAVAKAFGITKGTATTQINRARARGLRC